MDLNTTSLLWARAGDEFKVDRENLNSWVRAEDRRLTQKSRFRDWLEISVGIYLIAKCFYFGFIQGQYPLEMAFMLLGLVFVLSVFLKERWLTQRNHEAKGLEQTLQISIAGLEHQVRLLNRVWAWYILPVYIPLVFYAIRAKLLAPYTWLYLLVVLVIALFIDRLNKRVVQRDLEPHLASQKQLLRELIE